MRFLNKNNIFIVLFTSLLLVKFVGPAYSISIYPIAIILIIFLIISENIKLLKLKNYWILILLVFTYTFTTFIWTGAINYGLRKLFLITAYLIIGVLSLNLFSVNRIKFLKFSGIIFFSILLILLFIDFNLIIENSLIGNSRYRIDDETNSNTIAVFFGIGVIISLYNYLIYEGPFKLFFLFSTVSFIAFSVFNGSRGNLIAIICSIIFVNLLYVKTSYKAYLKYLFFVLVILIIAVNSQFFHDALDNNFIKYRFFEEKSYDSLNERLSSYELVLSKIDSNIFTLFFGNGIGDFGYLLTGHDAVGYPHNIFLEIIYELGFFIFFIFLFFIVEVHKRFHRLRKYNKVTYELLFLINLFLYFLLFSMSSGDITDNFLIFIFLMFLHNILNKQIYVKK